MYHTPNEGNDGLFVQLRQAASYGAIIKFVVNGANVELQRYNNGAYSTIQTVSPDTWYVIGIDYDGTNSRYKYRVNNGDWSSYDVTGTSTNTAVDIFRFGQDTGWECYFDYISPDNPNQTATATLTDGVKVGDVITAVKQLALTLVDGINLGDVVTAAKVKVATVLDGMSVGDTITAVKIKISSILDGLNIGDVISSSITAITQWTNRTKPTTTFTDRTKPSSSWTNRTKPTTNWTKHDTF